MNITNSILDQLFVEAARAHPAEACGILFGKGNEIHTIQPARNVHTDPQAHFEIDPQALIDAHRAARSGGPQVAGYYHSHPLGEAFPSPTDRAMARGDGCIWAIVAGDDVTFWRSDEDGFAELSYTVIDR